MSKSDWPLYIFSSLTQYFQAVADAYPIHLYIEGTKRRTTDKTKHIELRIDGPTIKEISHNYFKLDVSISVLWSVDMTTTDFHEQFKVQGMILEAMDDICITKTDGTHLGTLILTSEARTVPFGQVKDDAEIVQGTVDGDFEMHLDN